MNADGTMCVLIICSTLIGTKDEEGNTIVNPEEAKEHIADYFEDIYQVRNGEKSHKEWAKHINKQVERIEQERRQQQTQQAFTDDELNQCIRKLNRKKSTGPDNIPNEAIIEADRATREIYLEVINKIYHE